MGSGMEMGRSQEGFPGRDDTHFGLALSGEGLLEPLQRPVQTLTPSIHPPIQLFLHSPSTVPCPAYWGDREEVLMSR